MRKLIKQIKKSFNEFLQYVSWIDALCLSMLVIIVFIDIYVCILSVLKLTIHFIDKL